MNQKPLLSLLLVVLSTIFCSAAMAQTYGGYNANGNDSRVVYGGNGLANPSGTYIGGGTMSQSARGQIGYGSQVNRNIPSVSWGSHVGTAGDNQYTANPITNGTGQPQRQAQRSSNGLPTSKWGANIGTAGDTIRSDLNPNYYAAQQQQQRRVVVPNPMFQQVIQSSGHGPLRYDGVSGSKMNF